ncbi:MAG: hypothetical protein GX971_06245 [Firmicutes bacterium]|nr:hypothetical protein [Bacillota bacterium]
MKYLPWALAGLLTIALVWALTAGTGGETIGTVNLLKVVDESPRAQELNQMLADRYNELITQFNLEEEPTEEDVDRANRERQAYAQYLAYRQELETQLQTEVDSVIKKVAERLNISVVLDDDVVRFGGRDISAEVIRELQ